MNKNDFKCGQWLTSSYKVTGLKAIKFKCWDPNYPNCPLLTEAIADGVLDVNHNTGGIWNSDYGRGLRPIHLDEIQQYLPDGHPDKYVTTIQKWCIGSYVVFLTDEVKTNSGAEITKGKPYRINEKQYDLLYSKSDTKKEFNFFWEKEECRWFATLEEAEKFAATIKQSVEKKEFIPDDNLSSYIGRYLEALVDSPLGGSVKKGEYGLIINRGQANFPSHVGYYCSEALKKNNLNIRYRLMPEGFTPLVKEEEWKPKVGDWVVTDNLNNGDGGEYNGHLGQVWQIGNITGDWYRPVESMKFKGGSLELHNLRKATQQEIDSMSKTADVKFPKSKFEDMSKDELLEYAKKKYPVGTRYKTAGYSETEYVVEGQTFEYYDGDIHGEDGKGILYRDGKWAEIVEPPKAEVLTSNQSTYQPIVTSYSYNGVKETHQSINIEGKKFSPIKAELIKVKQLKIN
jgi:hypothetical protein